MYQCRGCRWYVILWIIGQLDIVINIYRFMHTLFAFYNGRGGLNEYDYTTQTTTTMTNPINQSLGRH